MMLRRTLTFLAAFVLVIGAALVPQGAAPVAVAGETVSAIVEFQRAPVGPAAARADRAGVAFDAASYRQLLLDEQQAFLERLASLGIDATVQSVDAVINDSTTTTVRAQFTYVFNGLGLLVDVDATPVIASLPGVRAVHPDRPVTALLDVSVAHIGAPRVWSDLGTMGEGQAIAVIDTGIDWTHPMFGAGLVPGETHPKVKFYMTFTAGGPDGHGHGTHVAGIAAGDRDFGETLTGPALFNGVAPKADLWGYKVLSDAGTGSSLSVILGIEDAAARGASVINLSLGSDDGDPESATSRAVNNANDAGVAVAVAAGNSGPGYSTIGSPASAHKAVTFGASTDPGDNEYHAFLADDPARRMGIIPLSNSPVPTASQQALYFDCGLALTVAECAGASGRIALIERGGTTFTQKALNAEAAGAIAAVIYNSEPGNFAGTLIVLEPNIPVVAMSQEDGRHLLTFVDPVTRVSTDELALDWSSSVVISDQVAGFSSRGPNDDNVLKPDVVAPGNNITSSVPPVGQLASPDRYSDAGGTSMASPHGAGALALLRALNPAWEPEWVKTALMNTAVQLTDPADGELYSVHDQGAGRIDVYAAATIPALVGETYADGRLARGSVNFGEVETFGGTVTVSKSLLIQDVSGDGGRWKLSFEPGKGKDRGGEGRDLPAPGFDIRFRPANLNVGADASRTFTIELTLDGSQLAAGDYEGRIVATGAGVTLRVPLTVRVSTSGTFGTSAPTLDDPGDVSTTGDYTLTWSRLQDARAYRLQEATTFSEHLSDDMESGTAKWTADGWTQSQLRANSGSTSWFSGQGPELNTTLTTAEPIALQAGSGVTLSFWTFYDIEPGFDFGFVEVSTDGGSTWEAVAQLDGHSGGWVKVSADLSPYAGETVLVRFRYDTDLLIDLLFHEGWYVDDVSIDSADWTTIAETRSTRHNARDQADGTYFYRVAALISDRGFGKMLTGPWSNVVDIVVER